MEATVPAVAATLGDNILPMCANDTCAADDSTCITSSPFDKDDDDNEHDMEEDDDEDNGTTWNVLTTLYFPIVLLWLRRSMFGTANLIRSIVLGQILHLLLNFIAPHDLQNSSSKADSWWEAIARWLHLALAGNTATNKHTDAWPPPALTALAILTVFCLVVHPDGLTWIMIGKLRDAIVTFLRSSTTFWTMLIHDYGIISTIAAGLTLATIGCILAIMLRTLTPRKRDHNSQLQHLNSQPERKKKKRKGQFSRGRGRIRPTNTAKNIPEHEDAKGESTGERQEPLMHDPATNANFEVLPPVPEPRAVSPEITLRPRIQSSATLESVVASTDDHSTTSSVRSFGSAPTVQTVITTSSERSSADLVSDMPSTKGKMNIPKSLNGMKKAVPTKKGTSLAVERGDGQPSPGKPVRISNKVPKPFRNINMDSKDPAGLTPSRSEFKGTPSRRGRGHTRQPRGSYPTRHHLPSSVSPAPPVDTDSFFSSSPLSPCVTSNLNAASPPYTPKRLPSSNAERQIESSPPPGIFMQQHSPCYSAPTYTQPYSQACWATTPIRPPPGLGGHPFSRTFYAYEQNDHEVSDENDSRIEAEMQELGGQMVGSILDF